MPKTPTAEIKGGKLYVNNIEFLFPEGAQGIVDHFCMDIEHAKKMTKILGDFWKDKKEPETGKELGEMFVKLLDVLWNQADFDFTEKLFHTFILGGFYEEKRAEFYQKDLIKGILNNTGQIEEVNVIKIKKSSKDEDSGRSRI